jgi:hypothetical protein
MVQNNAGRDIKIGFYEFKDRSTGMMPRYTAKKIVGEKKVIIKNGITSVLCLPMLPQEVKVDDVALIAIDYQDVFKDEYLAKEYKKQLFKVINFKDGKDIIQVNKFK